MLDSKPLKVLFLGKDAGRGGMQKELLSIVQFLDRDRFTPLVLLQDGGDLLPFYKNSAPTEVYSERSSAFKARQPHPRVRRWLPDGLMERLFPQEDETAWANELAKKFDPQLIVRQYVRPSAIYRQVEESSVPTLQTFLMTGAQTERLSEDMLQWVVRNPIVCTGRGVAIHLEHCMGVEPSNIHEICTGLDLSLIDQQLKRPRRVQRSDLGIGEDDIVIATSGALIFPKGVDVWVEAAAILRNRFPNRRFKFMWIGGAKWQLDALYGQSIHKMIAKFGLQEHVIITGDQEEIYPFVNLCDIYVQPSRDDAYPLATREGMALSKPVVTFRQGIALEKYAQHALVIVPQFDADSLADGIMGLMENPDERERLGAAGRKVIEDHLEINGTMRRYEELLLSIAAHKTPRSAQTS